MTIEEICKKINDAKVYAMWKAEEMLPAEAKEVDEDLYVETHRWFQISTRVFAVGDGFIGLTGVTTKFSEGMDWEDCGVEVSAKEMFPLFRRTFSFAP